LDDTLVDLNQASSIQLVNATAALFSEPGYQGRCLEVDASIDDLSNSLIGNDHLASLIVNAPCPPGAVLCQTVNFANACERFDQDVYTLADTKVGLRQVSSILVSPGVVITVYSDAGYRGRCQVVSSTLTSLVSSEVGNDAVSSLRIGAWC
jgi:hypothetical protein